MTRLRLRRLAALVGTLALLAGLPWSTTFLSWPVLDLSPLTWEVHLRSGRLPTGVGTAMLIVALWSVWVLYVLTLATELLTRLRHRTIHLGPLRPLQLLAATTLGTITIAPAAHAATPSAAVTDTSPEAEASETAPQEAEQGTTEPMVIERSRVIDSFGYDSATLTPDMIEDVETTADLLVEHSAPELPIVVTGHTDAAGDPDYNRDLSEQRAQVVADVLRTHLDEDVVIEVHGDGDRTLLDTTDDAEQRRVEIGYSVVVTPPGEPSPGTPLEEDDPADESEVSEGPGLGLSLPGGLVLAMTTTGLGVLGGMALERRHELRLHKRSDLEETENPVEHPSVSDGPTSEPGPDTVDGPRTELALVDLSRAPGLGITGPGAHGAARTLLARSLDNSEDDVTVVVPEADLRVLLNDPRRLPTLNENAPVMVTDTVEDALTLLQLQVLAHHRAADEAADQEVALTGDRTGPQFVLLAQASAHVAAEVTSLLAHIEDAPLSAVLLGPWPSEGGPTLTLDEHGVVIEAGGGMGDLCGHRWALATPQRLHQALAAHRNVPATPPQAQDPVADSPQEEASPDEPSSTGSPPTDGETDVELGAVSVTVLGAITLAAHGQQVRPHRRAAYEVLAYLAAHPAGARLDTAVDAMWPEEPPHRAIRRFHDACTAVRSAVRERLGEAATAVITHDGDRYRLNPRLVTCDLWRIDQLLDEATHSAESAPVTAAAAMFDNDFAAGNDYLWAESVRVRVREPLVSALIEHAESEKTTRAISMLKRALRIDPASSEAVQALAARYDEKGDQKSAERVRSEYEEVLEGLDPSR